MRAGHPTITRCKAVAAHGRRCMQTPYITSPFCWHHTARASRDELRRDSLRGDERSKVTAERIVRLLTDEQMTQIAESLDAGRDLAIHIEPL